jgi:hypothetical protein
MVKEKIFFLKIIKNVVKRRSSLSAVRENEWYPGFFMRFDKSCSGKFLNMNREHEILVYHEGKNAG